MNKVLLVFSFLLLVACKRAERDYTDYVPTGGGVEFKGLDARDHTFLRVRWYSPSGQTYYGNWSVTLDDYNKHEVGSWWGDAQPRLVLSNQAQEADRSNEQAWAIAKWVLRTLIFFVTFFSLRSLAKHHKKRQAEKLPKAKVTDG